MSWVHWALLSAFFAGITAVLAKAGTKDIEPNLATAIRTMVVLFLAWGVVRRLQGRHGEALGHHRLGAVWAGVGQPAVPMPPLRPGGRGLPAG